MNNKFEIKYIEKITQIPSSKLPLYLEASKMLGNISIQLLNISKGETFNDYELQLNESKSNILDEMNRNINNPKQPLNDGFVAVLLRGEAVSNSLNFFYDKIDELNNTK